MTILIGLAPGTKGHGALHLGAMLARSTMENVLLATVVAEPWPPNIGGGDLEYLAYQDEIAEQSLREARDMVGSDILTVETLTRRAPSVASGLLQIIAERQISLIALGSSPSSALGRVMLGGVTERVLHGSSLPVAVAPRGYHLRPPRVSRVSVAVGRADQDGSLVGTAVATARAMEAPVRLVCFAVRPNAAAVTVEPGVEYRVADEWRQKLEADLSAALDAREVASATGRGTPATRVKVELGTGPTWGDALQDVPWNDGDVLVVGTSTGPLSRFFLGSHATKIIRNSPVPVILVPREQQEGEDSARK